MNYLVVKAFVKRLLQISFSQGAPFICGSFILTSELLKAKKGLFQLEPPSQLLTVKKHQSDLAESNGQKAKILNESDDDEDEHFVDAPSNSKLAYAVSPFLFGKYRVWCGGPR